MRNSGYCCQISPDSLTQCSRSRSVKDSDTSGLKLYCVVEEVGDCLNCLVGPHTAHVDIAVELELTAPHGVGSGRRYESCAFSRCLGNLCVGRLQTRQSYGCLYHAESNNGILSAYDLPDSQFDTHIKTTLTRRHTKETLGDPNTYTILQQTTDLDFLDKNCTYYDIEFRIVRILLDNGTYICIATNLSEEDFPLEEIKKLYRMRWSEETSFRELKYTIGLVNWHSSKYDGILQELNARMILYNFCEFVTAQAVVRTRDNTKHIYKINFATAVNICRAYLKHSSDEIETMLLIQKHLTPVRSNRKYPIRLRPKRNRDFMYRAA